MQPQKQKKSGGIKSLEDLGLDGDSNVASEFTEDLGLDKYKTARKATGLPLKAVAAGLGGLLSALSMPDITREFMAAKSQISNST